MIFQWQKFWCEKTIAKDFNSKISPATSTVSSKDGESCGGDKSESDGNGDEDDIDEAGFVGLRSKGTQIRRSKRWSSTRYAISVEKLTGRWLVGLFWLCSFSAETWNWGIVGEDLVRFPSDLRVDSINSSGLVVAQPSGSQARGRDVSDRLQISDGGRINGG